MLEESLANARAADAVNSNAQEAGGQVEHQQNGSNGNLAGGLHPARASGLTVEDLEAGRRGF